MDAGNDKQDSQRKLTRLQTSIGTAMVIAPAMIRAITNRFLRALTEFIFCSDLSLTEKKKQGGD